MPGTVILQQAVFGYSSGHNLLATSLPLSDESRRTLAILTDASGPWPSAGFEEVITGIPLPDAPYYALFCTWPAPEMPRPGCVWSHVILIELADLAGLADLSELRRAFQKPNPTVEGTSIKPIRFDFRHDKAIPLSNSLEKDGTCFLTELYGKPSVPFVTQASDVDTYSGLIFAIWSQQWPRLRRNFRFSTGSFSDRGRGGIAFDLQIAPSGNYSAWRRTEDQSKGDVADVAKSRSVLNNWIHLAINDLKAPSSTEFRAFLSSFGADVNNPREAFARLSAVYEKLIAKPIGTWEEKLRFVAEVFPNPSEALRLKEWLIEPVEITRPNQDLERMWETTAFLLAAQEAKAYTSVTFDSAGVAPFLWKTKRKEITSLAARLMRQAENPSAAAFVIAIANSIHATDLRFVSDQHPELISLIVRHHPLLAFEPETWQLPEHVQWRVYETLEASPLKEKEWSNIMAAMFITATTVATRNVVERAGAHAIEGAFRWLQSPIAKEYLPSQIWREALAGHAAIRLADSKPLPPDQLALCAWLVPPRTARESLNASRQDIQRLAELSLERLPRPLRVPTAFLLVSLGLRNKNPEGMKLILRGFFLVYDALATSQYSSDSWSLLAPELPLSPFWTEWDRCKKLRRALRQRGLNENEIKQLIETAVDAHNREVVRKIVYDKDDDDQVEFID
jgi:hypothetical protein